MQSNGPSARPAHFAWASTRIGIRLKTYEVGSNRRCLATAWRCSQPCYWAMKSVGPPVMGRHLALRGASVRGSRPGRHGLRQMRCMQGVRPSRAWFPNRTEQGPGQGQVEGNLCAGGDQRSAGKECISKMKLTDLALPGRARCTTSTAIRLPTANSSLGLPNINKTSFDDGPPLAQVCAVGTAVRARDACPSSRTQSAVAPSSSSMVLRTRSAAGPSIWKEGNV